MSFYTPKLIFTNVPLLGNRDIEWKIWYSYSWACKFDYNWQDQRNFLNVIFFKLLLFWDSFELHDRMVFLFHFTGFEIFILQSS